MTMMMIEDDDCYESIGSEGKPHKTYHGDLK